MKKETIAKMYDFANMYLIFCFVSFETLKPQNLGTIVLIIFKV